MDGRFLRFVRGRDGEVRIEGQDLGPAVESIMGAGIREYEWTWVIDAADDAPAVEALGGAPGDDLVQVLKRWSKANGDRDPGVVLKDAGVPMNFWSRFGD